jgi:outer membrane protein assembly factor BamE
MHLFAKILLLISLTITASGCSNFSMPKVPKFDGSFIKLPEVYKIDIQQGNVITQDMIDKLKPGMTKVQVKFIMGTPLIADTFNQNRWDYFYGMKPAKGPEVRERMAIFFKDDKLSSLRGDFMPNPTSNEPIE